MEAHNMQAFSYLIVGQSPQAEAKIQGNDSFPQVQGWVRFYAADKGTLVVAEVAGLPTGQQDAFFAFHLHAGGECGAGAGDNPFAATGGHYNPMEAQHPGHAGDFPPLMGNNGYAYASFYTGRLTPEQAVGKTVAVHRNPDDFRTQPSGNAGMKIACGPVARVSG